MGGKARKKSLVRRLGIKPGFVLAIKNAPHGYEHTLGRLPKGFIRQDSRGASLDFIQYFAHWKKDLADVFPLQRDRLKDTGMLWVSWPKMGSKLKTDLTEDRVRALGLRCGLVDVKVCGIDENWSALKFVWRLKDRKKKR